MRDGPKFLSMYMGYASVRQMQHLQEHLDGAAGEFSVAEMERFVAGVQRYQSFDGDLGVRDRECVWRCGSASVQNVVGEEIAADRPVVLLVPSLINGSAVFDLPGEASVLRSAEEEDAARFLFDWGDVSGDEGVESFDDLIVERLAAAITFLARENGRKVFVVGYCLGGVLSVGACAHVVDDVAGLVCVATPWRFDCAGDVLSRKVRFWVGQSLLRESEKAVVAGADIHAVLASMNPAAILRKFMAFGDAAVGSDQERLFVAVEDWLNGSVDIPMCVARECVDHFFVSNRPVRGEWFVRGNVVEPAAFSFPALVVCSDQDKLVDYESAYALVEALKEVQHINPACGHIGMVAGRRAQKNVWDEIFSWVGDVFRGEK